MPWDKRSIVKHNRSLSPAEASKASKQANAILEKSGDEGMALAVANKSVNRDRVKRQVKHLQRSGMVSARASEKRGLSRFGSVGANDVDAATA